MYSGGQFWMSGGRGGLSEQKSSKNKTHHNCTYTRFQAYQVRGYTTYHDYLGHIQLELMLKSIVDGNFACKCIFMTQFNRARCPKSRYLLLTIYTVVSFYIFCQSFDFDVYSKRLQLVITFPINTVQCVVPVFPSVGCRKSFEDPNQVSPAVWKFVTWKDTMRMSSVSESRH